MASSWEDRQVVCRGLVIQIKGAGYDTDYRYEDFVRAIINKLLTSHETRRFIGSVRQTAVRIQRISLYVVRASLAANNIYALIANCDSIREMHLHFEEY